jgi:hypothetical protein
MLTEIECLWMINVSSIRGLAGDLLGGNSPPSDPLGGDTIVLDLAVFRSLLAVEPGLCRPVSHGRASPKFLAAPKLCRKP